MSYPYNYQQRCAILKDKVSIADQKQIIKKLTNDIEKLQKEFDQWKRESIKWSVEDLIETAKQYKYKLSKKKAQEALEDMIRHHDPCIGITWETIRYYVEIYLNKD